MNQRDISYMIIYSSWDFFATSDKLRADILKHRSYIYHKKCQYVFSWFHIIWTVKEKWNRPSRGSNPGRSG